MFDPAEDYMIRMLPEGFFYDMALRIGGIFIISMLIFLAVSVFLARQAKKDENERKIKTLFASDCKYADHGSRNILF